jgi:sec-independent protein translocase protein TatB
MIDVSWGHLVIIAVVALIVIGPKELPTVLRTVGHWSGKIRRMAAEFQSQFQEALREAEVADLKQHFDDISTAAKDLPRFDPVSTIRKEIEQAAADKPSPPTATPSPSAPTQAPTTGEASNPASAAATAPATPEPTLGGAGAPPAIPEEPPPGEKPPAQPAAEAR